VWGDSGGRTSINPGHILLTRTFVRAKFHAAVFAMLFTLQNGIVSARFGMVKVRKSDSPTPRVCWHYAINPPPVGRVVLVGVRREEVNGQMDGLRTRPCSRCLSQFPASAPQHNKFGKLRCKSGLQSTGPAPERIPATVSYHEMSVTPPITRMKTIKRNWVSPDIVVLILIPRPGPL
jgi:hypothetical protein